MYIHVCIYNYIWREREREMSSTYVCVYIYIYMSGFVAIAHALARWAR